MIKFLDSTKKEPQHVERLNILLGDTWKTIRFRNLVRLGADIENAGLASLAKPTLIGALLFLKEKQLRVDNG